MSTDLTVNKGYEVATDAILLQGNQLPAENFKIVSGDIHQLRRDVAATQAYTRNILTLPAITTAATYFLLEIIPGGKGFSFVAPLICGGLTAYSVTQHVTNAALRVCKVMGKTPEELQAIKQTLKSYVKIRGTLFGSMLSAIAEGSSALVELTVDEIQHPGKHIIPNSSMSVGTEIIAPATIFALVATQFAYYAAMHTRFVRNKLTNAIGPIPEELLRPNKVRETTVKGEAPKA